MAEGECLLYLVRQVVASRECLNLTDFIGGTQFNSIELSRAYLLIVLITHYVHTFYTRVKHLTHTSQLNRKVYQYQSLLVISRNNGVVTSYVTDSNTSGFSYQCHFRAVRVCNRGLGITGGHVSYFL